MQRTEGEFGIAYVVWMGFLGLVSCALWPTAVARIALIDPAAFAADRAGTPYLAPQVLVDVNHGMRVMSEESFGPVVGPPRPRATMLASAPGVAMSTIVTQEPPITGGPSSLKPGGVHPLPLRNVVDGGLSLSHRKTIHTAPRSGPPSSS